MESFLLCFFFVLLCPYRVLVFFLDEKVICSHPVWGLWWELERAAGSPQVWALPISKGRPGGRRQWVRGGADGGKEIWRSIMARDWHSFTILYTDGVLLGWENKKDCSAYVSHRAVIFPYLARLLYFKGEREWERQRNRQRERERPSKSGSGAGRVRGCTWSIQNKVFIM